MPLADSDAFTSDVLGAFGCVVAPRRNKGKQLPRKGRTKEENKT